MTVKDISRISVLTFLIITCGLSLTVVANLTERPEKSFSNEKGPFVKFTEREQGGYALEAKNVTLATILRHIAKEGHIQVDLDPVLEADTSLLSTRIEGDTLEALLKQITGSSAFVYERVGDELLLTSVRLTSQQEAVTAKAENTDAIQEARSAAEQAMLEARGVLTNSEKPLKGLMTKGSRSILLQNAYIDTEAAAAGKSVVVPESFRAAPETSYHIIQFDHVLSDAEKEQIAEAGGAISHYVPHSAYAMKLTEDAHAFVKGFPGYTYSEPYHPYYKMSSDVLAYMTGQPNETATKRVEKGRFNIMMFRGAEGEQALSKYDATVVRTVSSSGREIVTVEMDHDQLEDLLKEEVVQWLEPDVSRKAMNDLQQRTTRVDDYQALHPTLDGQGVIIGVTDSGVDFTHQGYSINPTLPTSTNLNTRIAFYEARTGGLTADGFPGDNNGHGTHVSGTILGNGALSGTANKVPGSGTAPFSTNQFRGVAPGSQLVMLEDFNSFTDQEQTETHYEKGARLSNNSWGADVFEYGTFSAIWDALVLDAQPNTPGNQKFTAFFAAGNAGSGDKDGGGGTANTIGSPGNAKNVITVGAVEQRRYANNVETIFFGSEQFESSRRTDTDWQISQFSSRGPTDSSGLRIKPDIVAPGSYVASIQSHEVFYDDFLDEFNPYDYRFGNVDTGTNYAFLSGTSMATPMATGAGALFIQYYTNTFGTAPTPALIKAALVGGAKPLNNIIYRQPIGFNAPTIVDQGWGLLDLERTVDGSRIQASDALTFRDTDATTPLNTDEEFAFQVTLLPGDGGMKLTLAWSDPPGTPGNAIQTVNDLDLLVLAPGGGGYLGNRFDDDGVHSLRVDTPEAILVDGWNNVETIVIPPGRPGTYTVKVFGFAVADGPQDFALVTMKGIGYEGRTPGIEPDIVMNDDDEAILVYSFDETEITPEQSNITRQVFLRKWVGSYGDDHELGEWKRLEGQWFDVRNSASVGISTTLENSREPSVDVDGDNIYVAWQEDPRADEPETLSHIFLRKFDGANWVELANSAQGEGLSGNTNFNATAPNMAVANFGIPVVSWHQEVLGGSKVFLAWFDGANWQGFGGSHTNGIPGGVLVGKHTMEVSESGAWIVVSWEELSTQRIRTRRWNGSAWIDLGQQGSAPFALEPNIAVVDNGDVFLTWNQLPSGTGSNFFSQVYGSFFTSGAWSSFGGSTTYPGISGLNSSGHEISSPNVALTFNGQQVFSWVETTDDGRSSVSVKRFDGSTFTGVGGAGAFPGVGGLNGDSRVPALAVDSKGIPVVAFENTESTFNETVVYRFVDDNNPPIFNGLASAVGGNSQDVKLTWQPATDISSTIRYTIYQGTTTAPCGTPLVCDANDVFSNPISTVANVTNFTVNGLTPNTVYCFGVRASDTNGLIELNEVMLSAGPVLGAGDNDGDCLVSTTEIAIGTEPCIQDTDGDSLWDGWEWTFSTNNVAHTNTLALNPLDNGVDNIRTLEVDDGDPIQFEFADPDNDGVSTIEEFNWWVTFQVTTNGCDADPANRTSPDPTLADTDGDMMGDGYEIVNGLNPTLADGNLDLDLDGVDNLTEFQLGSNPNNLDSDSDGISDSNEFFNVGTNPANPDSDGDGLDDQLEIDLGTDPTDADSNNNTLSDGDIFQLGFDDPTAATNFNFLICEDFEADSLSISNWTSYALNPFINFDFWHVTVTDPDPPTNAAGPNLLTFLHDHSTNRSYRAARDLSGPPGTNINATYSIGSVLAMALESPPVDATGLDNIFVQWNEYFDTEPNQDFVEVQARSGDNTNWFNASPSVAGKSGVTDPGTQTVARWSHKTASLEAFAGETNLQVRFVFTALNSINNDFPGWWVDDVKIYQGGSTLTGWVRTVDGEALVGAKVQALGRGGVTNIIDGHRVTKPGKIFGESITIGDGSYVIRGLPFGTYVVKATDPNHIDEFYNGDLFSPSYGFGNELNAGVSERQAVGPGGMVDLSVPNVTVEVDFELSRGNGLSQLGVSLQNDLGLTFDVEVNGQVPQIWNGNTNQPGAAFIDLLTTTNGDVLAVGPDWVTNPVPPQLVVGIAPGLHKVTASGTDFPLIPLPSLTLREGEITKINLSTNQPLGQVFVRSEDLGNYAIEINGLDSGFSTPAIVPVRVGHHSVRLLPGDGTQVGLKTTVVPVSGRSSILFTTNDVGGEPGGVLVESIDNNANVVTGAEVFVNGTSAGLTPVLVDNLRPGQHAITVLRDGYKSSECLTLGIVSGVTNQETFLLYQADRDWDRVGDVTEVLGYTNVFLYSRDDDPDLDGLSNFFEFEQFRLFNIIMNPLNRDSDQDGMLDGDEVGYDGLANFLAVSILDTNAVQSAPVVRGRFVGKFLAGLDHFAAPVARPASECDKFEAPVLAQLVTPVPTPDPAVTEFQGIAPAGTSESVSFGHNTEAPLIADGLPDRVDTDGDGMWDGFEFTYGLGTIAMLDVIECGRQNEDPDFDGLSNLEEFLGVDGIANTNDWSNPTVSDTDGDGMPDGFEYFYGFDPNDPSDAFDDPDGEGLINLSEYLAGTNPKLSDTDADGLPDDKEVLVYGSDPLNIDTDLDGLLDGREVYDKDLDGIQDGGFFPSWNGGDLDNDGLVDGPTDWDTDGDGMPDGFEVIDALGNLRDPALDPFDPTDGDDDPDGDGLSNLEEYLVRDGLFGNPPITYGLEGIIWDYSTDPFSADTDLDGMPDGFEVEFGLHPMDPLIFETGESQLRFLEVSVRGDPDGDGLWNAGEYTVRFRLDSNANTNEIYSQSSNPQVPDTDLDSLIDGDEDRSYRTSPILQDTDGDRLLDGAATGAVGEVSTFLSTERDYLIIACTNCTWIEALQAAVTIPHPSDPTAFGHLAVVTSSNENDTIAALFTGIETNVALGGVNDRRILLNLNTNILPGIPAPNVFHWLTGEDFIFDNFAAPTMLTTNDLAFIRIESNGLWDVSFARSNTFDHMVVEYPAVDLGTGPSNSLDQALNDLWLFQLPGGWTEIDDILGVPPNPRWGAAATYIPVYERKNPRGGESGTLLMDNRKFQVFGGRNGINRNDDIYEYWVASNQWRRAEATLFGRPDGLSEATVITLFSYRDNKPSSCGCDNVPYDCDGSSVFEPKNRPWSSGAGDGSESRTWDFSFIWGGWDESYLYYRDFVDLYKSKDDDNAIREAVPVSLGVNEYIDQPDGELTADSLDGGNTIVVGLTDINLDAGPDNTTGYGALNFDSIALFPDCDDFEFAQLDLNLNNSSGVDIDIRIFAEISTSLGNSDPEYDSELDTLEPSVRDGGGAYLNTVETNITVVSGFSGIISVEVTDMIREIFVSGNWNGTRVGFILDATGAGAGNAVSVDLRQTLGTQLIIDWLPLWRAPIPEWWVSASATTITATNNLTYGPVAAGTEPTIDLFTSLHRRKSHAMSYDYTDGQYLLFGGMDGQDVLGDTWIGASTIVWTEQVVEDGPEARWGHSMVYDPRGDVHYLFGGFDQNHRPLNDLWVTVDGAEQEVVTTNTTDGAVTTNLVSLGLDWQEITIFQDDEVPMPRGGANLFFINGFDYDRGLEGYKVAGVEAIVLFGGTDGNTYFNDTWVYNPDSSRWVQLNPSGQHNGGAPSPRAFAAVHPAQNAVAVYPTSGGGAEGGAFLFGGRTGTLPTGRDTDFDLIEDGTEYELGGPDAGRDPRVSRFSQPNHPTELYPFTIKRLGSIPLGLGVLERGTLVDFESQKNTDSTLGLPSERIFDPRNSVQALFEPFDLTGVEGERSELVELWYHRHGVEDPFDPRDVWELGTPNNEVVGPIAAPRYAYSGRWVFATDKNGNYPNDAFMELYSPLFDLQIPSVTSEPTDPNLNSYFLMYHEWLDMADSNDVVRIDLVRPSTPADINTRVTGLDRPVINVISERNNAFNTSGTWRRVVAPLAIGANDTNLYLRFTLQSDAEGVAGGWYIDDLAILQAGEIEGVLEAHPDTQVTLYGENMNMHPQAVTTTDGNGLFGFGLLPFGNYLVGTPDGLFGPIVLNGSAPSDSGINIPVVVIVNITMNSPMTITWPSEPGQTYRLDYSDNLVSGVWQVLAGGIPSSGGATTAYMDSSSQMFRVYRVVLTNPLP